MEAHDANYVGGDINGGIQDIRQLIFRPWPSLDPYRARAGGLYLVLVVDAARRRRPRDERDARRAVGAAPRPALTAARRRPRPSSRRSQTPKNSAPIAGTAVHITNSEHQHRHDDLDVGEAVLDDAALAAGRPATPSWTPSAPSESAFAASASRLSREAPATPSSRWSRPSMPVAIWPIRSAAARQRLGAEDVDRPELVLEVVELRRDVADRVGGLADASSAERVERRRERPGGGARVARAPSRSGRGSR